MEKPFESALDARGVPVNLCRQEQFQAGWAHLEELILFFEIRDDQLDSIVDLISNASVLLKLAIKVRFDDLVCGTLCMQRLISTNCCLRLQGFHLHEANMSGDYIRRFLLMSAATIRRLSFTLVKAMGGTSWSVILQTSASNFPYVDSFFVFRIKEMRLGRRRETQQTHQQPDCARLAK